MIGDYSAKSRYETGFDNYFDHQLFVHPSNPEYKEMCQECEMIDREQQERAELCRDYKSTESEIYDDLPF